MPGEQMTILEAAARAMCRARHPCYSIVAEVMSEADYKPGQEGNAAAITQAGELRALAAAGLEEVGFTPEMQAAPVGSFVVVPVEPTPEMMEAGERADWVGIVEGRAGMSIGPYPPEDWQREDIEQGAYSDPIEDRRGIWTAMLSARPSAKEGGA